MKFKDVAISDASTEAKVAALAVLLDKELLKLAETVFNVQKIEGPKGEQGLQGPKGEQGDRGFDGTNGKDGTNGADGRDGEDGKQGVGVQDAHIDFDGSLIITLTDGREINVGEVVPMDVAEKIKIIGNGGGTSQSILDAIDAINATIATYGTMALQNKTSVDIEGGTIDNTVIGATTPAAGTFTTLTATGQTSLGGAAGSEGLRVNTTASGTRYVSVSGSTGAGNPNIIASAGNLVVSGGSTSGVIFYSNSYGAQQMTVSHTASAVNYVQVTGAATGGRAIISTQGSDASPALDIVLKGTPTGPGFRIQNQGASGTCFAVTTSAGSIANHPRAEPSIAGNAVGFSAQGSDTNIDLALTPKGTGNVRFGTYTASMALTVQGYIEIKDSGGTVRKLAVIA